jgi:hypothetical protein
MKVEVTLDRPLELYLSNEHEAVARATESILRRVVSRTKQGVGARGPLPRPDDGGPPMVDTGTLRDSISMRVAITKTGRPEGYVFAFGRRPDDERRAISRGRKSARARTKILREAKARTLPLVLSRKAIWRAIRQTQVRTVVDNASLAAILSVPSKHRPARVVYRVFEATDAEQQEAAAVVRSVLKAEL